MQPNGDQSNNRNDPTSSHRRVTVPEAAKILAISPEAVRARIQRGTLVKDKASDGTVYVQLNADATRSNAEQRYDESHTSTRSNGDETTVEGDLNDVLREQVAFLRDQLAQEREANRENRRLLAAALERIPELEAPPHAREASETASEGQEGSGTAREQQEPAQRHSWLYRFFFGP
jgi:hypothetical protein